MPHPLHPCCLWAPRSAAVPPYAGQRAACQVLQAPHSTAAHLQVPPLVARTTPASLLPHPKPFCWCCHRHRTSRCSTPASLLLMGLTWQCRVPRAACCSAHACCSGQGPGPYSSLLPPSASSSVGAAIEPHDQMQHPCIPHCQWTSLDPSCRALQLSLNMQHNAACQELPAAAFTHAAALTQLPALTQLSSFLGLPRPCRAGCTGEGRSGSSGGT